MLFIVYCLLFIVYELLRRELEHIKRQLFEIRENSSSKEKELKCLKDEINNVINMNQINFKQLTDEQFIIDRVSTKNKLMLKDDDHVDSVLLSETTPHKTA